MHEDKIRRSLGILLLATIAAILVITLFAGFIIDYLWFSALNYAGVFWKLKLMWGGYFVLFALLSFAILLGNFLFAARLAKKEGRTGESAVGNLIEFDDYLEPFRQLTGNTAQSWRVLLVIITAILAVFAGLAMAPQWETLLRYFNQTPFGKTDPIFGNDLGFYVFSLPVYKLFRGWLLALTVLSFIGSVAIYGLNGVFRIVGRTPMFSHKVKTHLYALMAFGLLLKVWDYRLQMYDLLYSKSGLVFGAGYTDYAIQRRVLWMLLVYMLALAVWVISGMFTMKDRTVPVVIAILLILPIAIVLQGFLPGIIQQMIVKPNEFSKEEPFIKHNIAMTNEAYGLSQVAVRQFPAENSIGLEGIKRNEETVNNIRLWDPRPLLSTYQQIQTIRTYYTFYNVDIDRYTINGKVRQVMLAPRELERDKLATEAQTWVNTRLIFTHGYGLVMNPVNSVTTEGLPELFIKDIPPVTSVDLRIEQPAVYYGEQALRSGSAAANAPNARLMSDVSDYVIVKTTEGEFDYPAGDVNKETIYAGNGGVWMGSLFRRLLFAWGFKDVNILLTGATTSESRIMFRRNIQERIKHIAPFLALDRDPYIVLSAGRLFWIQDAYTVTDKYPYAEPWPSRDRPQFNYIRNSVKIVVDAYQGSVDFYLIDATDPLANTYQRIFPGLFKPLAEMPADLRTHLRYPQDLFQIQLRQYMVYHMQEPRVFYNKEDLWTIPNEVYEGQTTLVEPYYILMKLPEEPTLVEFILMNPLSPKNKDNMVAWFAARCDAAHYGELFVYNFPKDKLIYGPSQIEARIDQDTLISQQFSLWDQRGSNILRGNLLVIPIEDSILYVEPVYLKAEKQEIPELKRVIVSHSGEVAMGLNLQEALEAVFGGKLRPVEQQMVEQVPTTLPENAAVPDLIRQLADHFTTARQHLAEGNWTKYGEEMDKAEALIQRLQQQYGR